MEFKIYYLKDITMKTIKQELIDDLQKIKNSGKVNYFIDEMIRKIENIGCLLVL